ncbi:tRNA-2-methylthio-N(6)-dimethylallyladenosine synthase [uncultured archaeon]|nr:tRNA-2-methylthio-N(6)-dimethylallyladenosine synthase [uncultured archaeon]
MKCFSHSPVLFTSDSFGIDLEWMDDLLSEYSKITKLPFVLLLRPELATEKCIDILAKHNCFSVAIGVESGSERVRKEILNRHYSNDDLLNIAKMLHNYKIKFRTYNMIGLPTETEDEMWETIDINTKMKTDFPRAAIFTPMPNTKIVEVAKDNGYLESDFSFDSIPSSIFQTTILKKVNANKIENTLYFFQTAIIVPRSKNPLKELTRSKPNVLFKYWFYFMYAYLHKKSEKRALVPYIKYLFLNRHQV